MRAEAHHTRTATVQPDRRRAPPGTEALWDSKTDGQVRASALDLVGRGSELGSESQGKWISIVKKI